MAIYTKYLHINVQYVLKKNRRVNNYTPAQTQTQRSAEANQPLNNSQVITSSQPAMAQQHRCPQGLGLIMVGMCSFAIRSVKNFLLRSVFFLEKKPLTTGSGNVENGGAFGYLSL